MNPVCFFSIGNIWMQFSFSTLPDMGFTLKIASYFHVYWWLLLEFQVFRSTFLWTTLRHGNVIYFQCTYLVPFLRFRLIQQCLVLVSRSHHGFSGRISSEKKCFFVGNWKKPLRTDLSKLSFWNSRFLVMLMKCWRKRVENFVVKSLDNLSGCFCLFISVACYTVWDRSSIRVLSGNDCSCELIITIITLAIPES